MVETDEELIKACRSGDEAAWERIVYKYQNLLYSIPRRAGLSQDSAADALQEVFTTLFEKLDTLDNPEYLRAWLVTTTHYKTLQLIYRENRRKYKSIDDDEDESHFEIADSQMLPDEKLLQLEKEKQIETALASIDARCRRLLTMLYLEHEPVPYAEVAQLLNIPLGSIGPTRARCLKKLIKLLAK